MGRIRTRLTFANVTSVLALFIALGGGAYAAVNLPPNSVGSKQIKGNAIDSSKVRDGSLLKRDFRLGQLPKGNPGPVGPTGNTGPVGPTGPPGGAHRRADTWPIRVSGRQLVAKLRLPPNREHVDAGRRR